MSIKTELTNDEFIRLYGDSQWVRDFTREGQEAVLDHIEMLQGETEGELDWTGVFMEAAEYTADDMISGNNGFEIDEHADDLIDIANTIMFDAEIEKQLENENEVDNDDLWIELKDRLLSNAEFLQDAADMLGRHHGLTELDNGNWVKFA